MTTERVRWTTGADAISMAIMRGNVYLRVCQYAYKCYEWRATGQVGPHCVNIQAVSGKAATSRRQAKRRAREAGLMVQKIVGVK